MGAIAFLEEATSAATGSGIVEAITTAAEGMKSDAVAVIAVAVGIGIVFFGAKLIWGKFKGMAK